MASKGFVRARWMAVACLWSGGLAVVGAAHAQVRDHLQCVGVRDSAARATYTADLNGLTAAPGCRVQVPAKLLCVDTSKTNVVPTPPESGASVPAGRFLCYKVKCPKTAPSVVAWRDQFGTRTLTAGTTKLLCAPEIVATTTTTSVTSSSTTTVTSSTTTTTPPCGGADLQSDPANCGTCGNDCNAGTLHATFTCQAGGCQFAGCDPNFWDLDHDGRCEYACTFVSPQEECNAIDDNCDGRIDEAVVPPAPSAVCGTSPGATAPECTTLVTVSCVQGGWRCTFPPTVCSPSCAAAVDVCDGRDNDCDGIIDPILSDPTRCPPGAICSGPDSCQVP